MPKAILEFNLPEEQAEFDTAYKAGRASSLLNELARELRVKTKFAPTEKDLETNWEDVKDWFWKICQDYDIDPQS